MIERRFVQCDVFSETPLQGNGLAVVLDGDGLTDARMQAFAAWTQLAETTFLLPPVHPDADYRVRIFTPRRELDFAGHPTLGSCAAWRHAGGQPRRAGVVVQECNIGTVAIDIGGELPAFVAPPTAIDAVPPDLATRVLNTLGLDPTGVTASAVLANGSTWHVFELADPATLMAVDAARVQALPGLGIGLLAATPAGAKSQYDVRMLSESSPGNEDPITGSLNAAIGMWLLAEGRLARRTIMAQGLRVGRNGQVHLLPDPATPGQVLVGGRTHILIDGTIRL
jgi:PhzF family phenazine biosynthesis protein